MPGFFADECTEHTVVIREDAGHIVKTLRKAEGDALTVFDGMGNRLDCRITSAGMKQVEAEIIAREDAGTEPGIRVTLYQGLTRPSRMEYVIQKSVEIGIYRIVPVVFHRCEVREMTRDRLERYRKIAREAAKQCGRAMVPEVMPPISFTELMAAEGTLICPYEEADGYGLRQALEDRKGKKAYGIVIGPEGGMEQAEAERIREKGGSVVTLGPRILRTETAGIAVLSCMLCAYGEME